jgi:hypothetical protein
MFLGEIIVPELVKIFFRLRSCVSVYHHVLDDDGWCRIIMVATSLRRYVVKVQEFHEKKKTSAFEINYDSGYTVPDLSNALQLQVYSVALFKHSSPIIMMTLKRDLRRR